MRFTRPNEAVVQVSVIEHGSVRVFNYSGLNVFLMKWNRADWSVQNSSSAKVQPLDGYLNKPHALMSHTFDSFPSRPEGNIYLYLYFVDWWVLLSLRHLSSVLGNKFDHGAESIMPTLLNLVPNSAKIMATSGVAAIRLILRVSSDEKTILKNFIMFYIFPLSVSHV